MSDKKNSSIKDISVIDAIIEENKNNFNQEQRANFNCFVKELFRFTPSSDLNKYGVDYLNSVANSIYDFIDDRQKDEFKINVFNPTIKEDGWTTQNTIVQIVNSDMPFLVDSITEAISSEGYKIHNLLHPVLEVARNKKAYVEKITNIEHGETTNNTESIIYCKISFIEDKEKHEQLTEKIAQVIRSVRLCVKDFQETEKIIDNIIEDYSAYKKILDSNQTKSKKKLTSENINESQLFIKWLKDANFVFLGYTKYDYINDSFKMDSSSKKGIFKLNDGDIEPKNEEKFSIDDILKKDASNLIKINKANKKSLVHRPVHMDYITIKIIDESANIIGEHRLLGMFTSIVYHQRASRIPLLGKKIDSIMKRSGFSHSGHSGKALMAILQDFPRDELFQASEEYLFDCAMKIESIATRPQVKLFIRKDSLERFISCLIFIPRDKMSTELRNKMSKILSKELGGTISNHYTQITESSLARLQLIIKTTPGKIESFDAHEIEKQLSEASMLWEDKLNYVLSKKLSAKESDKLAKTYNNAFSISYKNRFSAIDGYHDIQKLQDVFRKNKVCFDFYKDCNAKECLINFKIYNLKDKIPLSNIMPILVNMGLETLDEHTYYVKTSKENKAWVHLFRFIDKNDINIEEIKHNFEDAIENIWHNKLENDGLNKLIVLANLKWYDVVIIRAYSKYLQQGGFKYSQSFIQDSLAKYPEITSDLVKLFYIKFDTKLAGDRNKEYQAQINKIEKSLNDVSDLAQDSVIRAIIELINATLRTNNFQKDENGNSKDYISFKLNSKKISFLPKPHPHAEIFVYSPKVEGTHLRGGKVARGGLRWSDRKEDFRTEVLGLMKAQMAKNSVIIPVGSKGGFVVKQPPKTGDRKDFLDEGIRCYKTFLRGLLDVTDNLVENEISPPKDVIRHDEDDPYLVVAADKGTATFSDIANGVSGDYNFWLADAFASGGTVGYDHKKMGITARGAWVSVQRHFSEIGVDIQNEDFSVIGIGDMGGDVFGNGMLLSEHIKLIGAFNHLHIFVDPNPDTKLSFNERKRLFERPRSSWQDYDESVISEGGAVFERTAKKITINKQIKKAFGINKNSLTPDELIKAMICADADLLWNGGIGTYVKSTDETHEEVGDKSNDSLRINGEDLKARVIGEGGNLGLTQLGRVEYALNGGRINTDAIDNSAGVDCSDHEVNIKIALGQAVEKGKLTKKERDKLLESMTDDVAKLVLRDNFLQTQALTITQIQGNSLINTQSRLLNSLEKEGYIDRKIEYLPDDESLALRYGQNKGLTRPEVSIIFAYSKIALFEQLLKTNLPDEEHFEEDLIDYFPDSLRKKYKEEICNHPLRREIISTVLTNEIVNRLGGVGFYDLKQQTGCDVDDILRAYCLVRDAFELDNIWSEIEKLDYSVDVDVKVKLFIKVQNLITKSVVWLLKHYSLPLNLNNKKIVQFAPQVKKLSYLLEDVLPEIQIKEVNKTKKSLVKKSINEDLADKISKLPLMYSAFDIVEKSLNNQIDIEKVSKIYFKLGNILQLNKLRTIIAKKAANSYWEKSSNTTLIADLFERQSVITCDILEKYSDMSDADEITQLWSKDNTKNINRYMSFIDDLKSVDDPGIEMAVVAISKLKDVVVI